MIVSCGENVIDMIMRADGSYQPVAGGSALNIAIGLGTLGNPTGYAMPVSADALGDMLVAAMAAKNVVYLPPVRPDRPTGLAVVTLQADGQPAYGFYRAGAADTAISATELPELGTEVTHLHMGGSPSLGHDNCGDVLLAWLAQQPQEITFSLDPNVRAVLVDDRARFLARCEQLIARCTVCRLSEEDAEYMYGTEDADAIVDLLLGKGAKLVAVTLGDQGAILAHASARVTESFTLPGKMHDAVAAGDTFMAALLTRLRSWDKLTNEAVTQLAAQELAAACRFACAAAADNCTRPGCDPPTMAAVEELLAATSS